MNILYVVSRAITAGGVMSIVSKKINYLCEKGAQITLLSMTKCDKPFYDLHKDVKLICCGTKPDFTVSLSEIIQAIRIIRSGKYDIIISADALYITWLLPFIAKTTTILEIHQSFDGLVDFYKGGRYPYLNVKFHRLLQSVVFPKYSHVVLLTEEDKKKWNLPNSCVIPNFHNEEIVIKNNHNELNKTIVCVGRFNFQKGVDLLIKIWKKVSNRCPGWKLYYYGIEPNEKVLSEMRNLGAPDSFILKGYEKNLSNIFSHAYLNIVPSRCESFSLTTIEAMCYGTPTVSFATTGPKAIISEGVNGVLVNCYDIEEAAKKIEELISDPLLREKLSKNCIKAAHHYTKEAIMKKWMKLFKDK